MDANQHYKRRSNITIKIHITAPKSNTSKARLRDLLFSQDGTEFLEFIEAPV